MSEEQSSGRAAARQCVRAPRSGGGWGGRGGEGGTGGDVTGIPRAEDRHDGQFSVSDDEIKKKKKSMEGSSSHALLLERIEHIQSKK